MPCSRVLYGLCFSPGAILASVQSLQCSLILCDLSWVLNIQILNVSEPQFSYLWNGHHDSAYRVVVKIN